MTIDEATITSRKQIASKYAQKHGLDVALICAVAHHESAGWNPWAIRFEPGFYDHYIVPMMNDGRVKEQTEAVGRSTSYGLMQIMGQTARELGFTGRFLTELCNPDVGLEFGCRKLKKCVERHPDDQRAALLEYNGGSDKTYPDKVQEWIPLYSSHTT